MSSYNYYALKKCRCYQPINKLVGNGQRWRSCAHCGHFLIEMMLRLMRPFVCIFRVAHKFIYFSVLH
jgi:hypothetical protein